MPPAVLRKKKRRRKPKQSLDGIYYIINYCYVRLMSPTDIWIHTRRSRLAQNRIPVECRSINIIQYTNARNVINL